MTSSLKYFAQGFALTIAVSSRFKDDFANTLPTRRNCATDIMQRIPEWQQPKNARSARL
jgi:hypothetical protein